MSIDWQTGVDVNGPCLESAGRSVFLFDRSVVDRLAYTAYIRVIVKFDFTLFQTAKTIQVFRLTGSLTGAVFVFLVSIPPYAGFLPHTLRPAGKCVYQCMPDAMYATSFKEPYMLLVVTCTPRQPWSFRAFQISSKALASKKRKQHVNKHWLCCFVSLLHINNHWSQGRTQAQDFDQRDCTDFDTCFFTTSANNC